MALVKATLKAAIKACLDDIREDKTSDEAAGQLADAIDSYIKTATVNTNVTGSSATGGPVVATGVGTLS